MVSFVRPVPDELTAPFWEAARQHRLALQRCRGCGRINHPPQVVCGWCTGTDLGYEEVPGTGRVCSYTTVPPRQDEPGDGPRTTIVVELDIQEGVLLVSGLDGDPPEWVDIGVPVRVYFERAPETVGDELVLPRFLPAAGGEG
ncbi:MAG: OB-fold domain-containing protein [Pseudonocardia sp.]|nr:OB-fold domain-containing protein [Pseudonocardia sp.]MBO0877778.1 OB-fold domain-containing protein [Pseudonocardia sp.]